MAPQGSFIHPAGARTWLRGRHRVKRELLPMVLIWSMVRALQLWLVFVVEYDEALFDPQ
jgi:hypothetical protein